MAHYHLSDILQTHYGQYQQHHRLSQQQRLVCQRILACRTAAL
ncbi:IS91 family transposase, partial [Shewanella ulleungensis]